MAIKMECPICDGVGWRKVNGGVAPCICSAGRYEEQARIPARFAGRTLENFQLPPDPEEARIAGQALLQVNAWVAEYRTPERPGLFFSGPPGTGKTHLAVAALREVVRGGDGLLREGRFYDYRDLVNQLRTAPARILELDEFEIVLIDELGSLRPTDAVQDAVESVINRRYNANMVLLLTTNLEGPGPLADRIGERSASRILEMCQAVSLSGLSDYRARRP